MNLMIKSPTLRALLLVFGLLWLTPSLMAQENPISSSLIRALAYTYHEQRMHQGRTAFQEQLEGVLAYVVAHNSYQGEIRLYINSTPSKRSSKLLLSFLYDLSTAGLLIPSGHEPTILPAHFTGEMGPLLIVYKEPHRQEQLIWFELGVQHRVLSSIAGRTLISYEQTGLYRIEQNQPNFASTTHFFHSPSKRTSALFTLPISIHYPTMQILYAPDYNTLVLADIFGDRAIVLDTEGVMLPSFLPESIERSLIQEKIRQLRWHFSSNPQERTGQLVIDFTSEEGGITRAFYALDTGVRLYF
jgi:hypothetical protein